MRAILIHEFGGLGQLKLAELPQPRPAEGEVLVRVKAAGVNPVDWKILNGRLKERIPHQFPLVLGWDMAGVVEEVGYSAQRFQVGDQVFAYCRRPVVQHGSYAEWMTLPESYLAHKPNNLSFAEAAAVPLAALTAYQSIFVAANLQANETLMVLGASGGVGSFAVQLAKAQGAKVVALASEKNHEYLKTLGADITIDYTQGDFRESLRAVMPDGVDVVFDCVGAETLLKGYDCVKTGGRLVSILDPEGKAECIAAGKISYRYVFVQPHVPQLAHIRQWIEADKVKVHLNAVYPLAEAAKALEQISRFHTRGKIVLQM
jgi:NADPH:quinone reductase-like Zn-dependent oxidoreductase